MNLNKEPVAEKKVISKGFSSPLFLVIAIVFSVILIATAISSATTIMSVMELLEGTDMPDEVPVLEIILGTISLPAVLAIAFLIASTACAWILFAKGYGKASTMGVRLHLAYSKIMNTIAIVFVSIIGASLVAGCFVLALVSENAADMVEELEDDLKPALEEMIEYKNTLQNSEEEFEKLFAEMDEETRANLNFESVEDFKKMILDVGELAEDVYASWDDIMSFLRDGFMTLAIAVACAYVLTIVALCIVSSALKKSSKYFRALSENEFTERKVPGASLYVGGSICAIGGIVALLLAPIVGIIWLLQGALLILLAVFFKQLKNSRVVEEPVSEEEDNTFDGEIIE